MAYWFGRWVWTYDPREEVKARPFDPFPRQVQFLDWLRERERLKEPGVADKSRDSGFTYLCAGYAVHGLLFRRGFSMGFGSHKLEYVDDSANPKSIFWKVRDVLYNLPGWMLPAGFDRKKHDRQACVVNPELGGTIVGEGGDNIGRGGRTSVYVVDEAAYLEHPDLADRALAGNTEVRIDVSTPNGPGNSFARKRFGGVLPVFSFHWRHDPRKTEEWAAKKKREIGPVAWAQEFDLDYTASIEGICIPAAWVRAAVNLDLPRSGRVTAGLDIAEEGVNKTVLIHRQGPVVDAPVARGPSNTTETAWWARDEARRLGVKELAYDVVGVGVGVKGTWATATDPLGFRPHAVNSGESPTETIWPDGRKAKEIFANLRAELWWKLRARFEKAYEFKEQGRCHPPEDMISIPNVPELIAELSMPLVETTDTGKIQVESKRKMRARGVKSPDYADALVLTEFAFPMAPVIGHNIPPPRSAVQELAGLGVFGPGT